MTGVLAWTALLSRDDPAVQLGDFIGAGVVIGGPLATATWLIVRRAKAMRTEHRRFAVGHGTGLLVAAAVGAVLAATTFFSSRASLAGDRTGSLFGVLVIVTPVVLLAVACGVGFVSGSVRSGVEVGFLAMLGALVGIVAVAMPEGARWAETAGVFILDGDAPAVAPTGRDGTLDALKSTLIFGPITWLPWPVIGAERGAALRRRVSAKQ